MCQNNAYFKLPPNLGQSRANISMNYTESSFREPAPHQGLSLKGDGSQLSTHKPSLALAGGPPSLETLPLFLFF